MNNNDLHVFKHQHYVVIYFNCKLTKHVTAYKYHNHHNDFVGLHGVYVALQITKSNLHSVLADASRASSGFIINCLLTYACARPFKNDLQTLLVCLQQTQRTEAPFTAAACCRQFCKYLQ